MGPYLWELTVNNSPSLFWKTPSQPLPVLGAGLALEGLWIESYDQVNTLTITNASTLTVTGLDGLVIGRRSLWQSSDFPQLGIFSYPVNASGSPNAIPAELDITNGSVLNSTNSTQLGYNLPAVLTVEEGSQATLANFSAAGTSSGSATINVGTGSSVNFTGSFTLGPGSFTLNNSGTITLPAANSVVSINNQTTGLLTISGSTSFGSGSVLSNAGTIVIPSGSALTLNTPNLSGGGKISLAGGSLIYNPSTSNPSLINVDNTIQGVGTISSPVINQGTIMSQGGTLTVSANITNTSGNIVIAANGTLSIYGNGATVSGGAITAPVGAQINGGGTLSSITINGTLSSSLSYLNNITLSNSSNLYIQPGSLSFSGTFTNHGTVTIWGSAGSGIVNWSQGNSGTTTFTGGGTVILTDTNYSRLGTASAPLTNVDNTIEGTGTIACPVINQGTIMAQGGTLTVSANITNTGNIVVAANNAFSVSGNGGTVVSGGTITGYDNSQINGSGTLSSITINGFLSSSLSYLNNITLSNSSNLYIQTGSVSFSGTFTNHGTVTIWGGTGADSYNWSQGNSGTTTFTGGGTVLLTNYSKLGTANAPALVNVDNTIEGTGTIACPLINQGTIMAQGGTLMVTANITNTKGNIIIDTNATLSIGGNGGTVVSGGMITAPVYGQINGGGTLSSITINGTLSSSLSYLNNITLSNSSNLYIQPGSVSFSGTFANHGTVTIWGSAGSGVVNWNQGGSGTTTFTGGGTVLLTNTNYSKLGTAYSPALVNADNTIEGTGTIACPVINQGTIMAQGGTLTLNGNITGIGETIVTAGNSISAGNFTQANLINNGTFSMNGNGTIGPIEGSGTLSLLGGHLVITPNSAASTQANLIINGTLDITNNKFIIESTASSKSSTISTLQNKVASHSIMSSTTNLGIAVLDNANVGFTTFGGQPVDANSILIAPEFLGDADLSGRVDLSDLNTVLNNLGTTNANWTSGNFDGATTIDLTDLNDVLNNLGTTYASPSTAVSSFSIPNSSFNILPTPTPEPTSLLLSALATLPLLTRRRPYSEFTTPPL